MGLWIFCLKLAQLTPSASSPVTPNPSAYHCDVITGVHRNLPSLGWIWTVSSAQVFFGAELVEHRGSKGSPLQVYIIFFVVLDFR